MKYQFNITLKNRKYKHAGSKATEDCHVILGQLGYKDINLSFQKSRLLFAFNLIKLLAYLLRMVFLIKQHSIIVVQYPLLGINKFFWVFIKVLRLKKCFCVCLIHDIDFLRYEVPVSSLNREISGLNAYDTIICHNQSMHTWLCEHGVRRPMINLELFDYLFSEKNAYDRVASFTKGNREVVFAGNLGRGGFIFKLDKVVGDGPGSPSVLLYGPNLNEQVFKPGPSLKWAGILSPEELVEKVQGNFGLIWDGDSIDDCEGNMGNYIQYNNPHKVSLYIASGLPLIIPAKAALRDFIVSHEIGIQIESLHDLSAGLGGIDNERYEVMCANITALQEKVSKGGFLTAAIKKVESAYCGRYSK